jgi:hypothetical protein
MEKTPVMINGLKALLRAPLNAVSVFYLTGVGDKGFIERIKSLMGVLAIGRKSTKAEESYQLREPSVPYGDHFGDKKGDIGPENPTPFATVTGGN